ncbi:MAG: cupin domain-containing protein [Chitinophagaceae bacterium]
MFFKSYKVVPYPNPFLLLIKIHRMQRRSFLMISLLAAPVLMLAKPPKKKRPDKGIKVDAGKDRFNSPIMHGLDLKLSGKDTDGDLCIFESTAPKKSGSPMHIHHHQDEWFYVFEGEMIIKVGNDTFHMKPGDSVFAPRGVPHADYIVSDGTRRLSLFQPAGSIEGFFGKLSKMKTFPASRKLKKLYHEFGMDIIGPPLVV